MACGVPLLNVNPVHHVGTSKEVQWKVRRLRFAIRCNAPPSWCKIMSRSALTLSSEMAADSLHVWRICVRKWTLGTSWMANRALITSWFLINLPLIRNISTNLFAWLRTYWIVATISLSETFMIEHYIFIVLPYLYRKCTTAQDLVFLIQRVETYLHDDTLFLEQGTCTRFLKLLLKRVPVFRQSVHFPQTMHPWL
jgi:hypothetical protein